MDTSSQPKEKYTLRWIVDSIHVSVWIWFTGAICAAWMAGFYIAQFQPINTWVKERLFTSEMPPAITDEVKELFSVNSKKDEAIKILEQQISTLVKQKIGSEKQIKLLEENLSALKNTNASLNRENTALKTDIDALKNQMSSLPPAQGSNELSRSKTSKDITAKQILQGSKQMSSVDARNFLIGVIPQVNDGITCDELHLMLGRCSSLHAKEVIIKIASYVRRPFTDGCFEKIGDRLAYTSAADALQALIESNPKY